MRRVLSWKFVFYEWILPVLRALGPARGDAILGFLGWLAMAVRPQRAIRMRLALERASTALDADWPIDTTWPALAANTARFLARDYPLDRQTDAAVLSRFNVRGYERLRATLSEGRGAILVGSHLGAHIAGVHWLFRRGVPLRLLVQRPRHVSTELNHRFDAGGIHPQVEMFLRRDLSPAVAVERVFRARSALRDGLAIYLNGDIPWSGPNTCPGTLLGRPQRLLAIWTELAVLTGAPVFLVFCTHLPAGRFSLEIEAIGHLRPGEEETAVADYLKQLEARIATSPSDAVAHLVWPCYQSPSLPKKQVRRRRAVGQQAVTTETKYPARHLPRRLPDRPGGWVQCPAQELRHDD
jgi:phosphatidylinositol dimannoside acyltransferase